jgi:2-polyprenyl-3-methyl-5-hydroxy-6-metoxy-1,4-benzoquinol methylase
MTTAASGPERGAPTADETVRSSLAEPGIHDRWEKSYRTSANESFYELVFDELARLVPRPQAVTTFLDAGCGVGAHATRLARRGFTVEAVDFSAVVVGRARENVASRGLQERIAVRQADLLELPFPAESFDNTLCWGVLMHIPDVSSALSELGRVTRRGGVIVVNEVNARAPEARLLRAVLPRIAKSDIQVTRTPAGFEHWTTTASGSLMWRHADIGWIIREASRHGLVLRKRMPGQLSELYSYIPVARLAEMVHALNRVWFERVGRAGPAVGNVLLFQKA